MRVKTRGLAVAGYDPERDGVTQSLLSQFLECREKARLYLERVTPTRSQAAMDRGAIYHEALERLYRGYMERHPEPWVPERSWVIRMIEELQADLEVRYPVEAVEKNAGMLEALLPAYVEFWEEDFTGHRDWIRLEQQFRIPAPRGLPVALVGKMDGAFISGPKSLWLFESKSKARVDGEALEDALPVDLQVQFYLYALARITRRKPRGVLYNVMRPPQLRQRKGEDWPAFCARCAEDVRARPEFYFHRWEVPVTRAEMDEFEVSLAHILEDFLRWWRGNLATYRNGSACMAHWGPCRFLPICGQGRREGFYVRETIFRELDRAKEKEKEIHGSCGSGGTLAGVR